MFQFFEYLTNNSTEYLAAIAAAILLFDRIAKITPTNTDNKILAVIYKIAAILSIKVKDNDGSNK